MGLKMNTDLRSYVMVLHNWFDKRACKQTVKEIENASWQQHTFYDSITGTYDTRSGSRELDISYGNNVSTRPYIMQRIWDAYKYYQDYHKFAWFNSWNGFSEVRFNMYKETRVMAEHCDHIHSMFDGEKKGIPTMTFLGTLNRDYTGGEFVMWKNQVIEVEEGTAIVFPSCFLYPHRVDPVTSGTRYSCVSWAY